MPRRTPSARTILRDIGAATLYASPLLIMVGLCCHITMTETRHRRTLEYQRPRHTTPYHPSLGVEGPTQWPEWPGV